VRLIHELAAQYSLSPDDERRLPDMISGLELMRQVGRPPVGPSIVPQIQMAHPLAYTDPSIGIGLGVIAIGTIGAADQDIRGWLTSTQMMCEEAQRGSGTICRGAFWESFKTYYAGMNSDGLSDLKDRTALLGLPVAVVVLTNAFADRLRWESVSFPGLVFTSCISGSAAIAMMVVGAVSPAPEIFESGGVIILIVAAAFIIVPCYKRSATRDAANRAEEQYAASLGLRVVDA
jgi:hypothetical protein